MPASLTSSAVEWLASRERAVVLLGLVVTIALAWGWLFMGGGMGLGGEPNGMNMPDMPKMGARASPGLWSGAGLVVFTMWSVMMAAMMLPSAAPAVLLYAAISRSRAPIMPLAPTVVFAAGYLLVWTAFSAAATVAHLRLQQAALLSPALRSTNGILAASLLILAGVYQLTPLKNACLRHCRSPVQFLTRYWRNGPIGALRLGVLHGGYCVGCCWALMSLLFVGGVMNLWWVALTAAFILVEKTAFLGRPIGRFVSGAGLMAAGAIALTMV